jgi:glycosyltransferase involved in cell wall biosynthesis
MKQPLVSILIPAYNSEEWIADCIQSALAQTWPHKEIIVVDDGSTDRTLEIARRFASKEVAVVSIENQGAAAARNRAFQLSKGDYIQWLDADDLLAPNKIESQLAALQGVTDPRILLSGPWGYFNWRTSNAKFVPNSLWNDLSPVEWLLRKMSENLHMQTATWLTSRELTIAAGPWDTRLQSDDDGEFFCRVLLLSNGTRFVPEARVFYRRTPSVNRVSYIGDSDDKKNSMIISMKLHVQYLRTLEDSDRVRKACCTYLQTWFHNFYPERPDLVAELEGVAAELQGHLEEPRLGWKYACMTPIFGWKSTKRAQRVFSQMQSALMMYLGERMYRLKKRRSEERPIADTIGPFPKL